MNGLSRVNWKENHVETELENLHLCFMRIILKPIGYTHENFYYKKSDVLSKF